LIDQADRPTEVSSYQFAIVTLYQIGHCCSVAGDDYLRILVIEKLGS